MRHFHLTSSIQKDNEVSHERVVIDDMVRGMRGDQTLDFELCRSSVPAVVLFHSRLLTYFSSAFFLLSISVCIIVRPQPVLICVSLRESQYTLPTFSNRISDDYEEKFSYTKLSVSTVETRKI